MNGFRRRGLWALILAVLLGAIVNYGIGCSVLAHEAIIGAAWDTKVKQTLLTTKASYERLVSATKLRVCEAPR